MAVNLALGVHYTAGVIPVNSNLVTLKPEPTTMASYAANNPKPASKHGALQVPKTTQRNLVTRRGKRITVTASSQPKFPASTRPIFQDAPAPSPTLAPTPLTTIQFVNSTGSVLGYYDHHFWQGSQDTKNIPKTIGSVQDYTHRGNPKTGSVGGLLYLLDNLVYWVVAWSNIPGSVNNKVYTAIFSSDTPIEADFWNRIYEELMQQSNTCDDNEPDLGYSAHLNITAGSTPTVTASFSTYRKSG